jgi:hypothetical protein
MSINPMSDQAWEKPGGCVSVTTLGQTEEPLPWVLAAARQALIPCANSVQGLQGRSDTP